MKKISTFTKHLLKLVKHKKTKEYPAVPVGEARRRHDVRELNYFGYDSVKGWEIFIEIIELGGNRIQENLYNEYGRAVIHNPDLYKKPKGVKGTDWEPDPSLPKFIEKETNWDQADIALFIDNCPDEEIAKYKGYAQSLYEDCKMDQNGTIQQIQSTVINILSYDRRFQNLNGEISKARQAASEIVILVEDLKSLIEDVRECDARTASDILKGLNICWLSVLGDQLRYNGIRDIMENLYMEPSLEIKCIRHDLKTLTTIYSYSDRQPLSKYFDGWYRADQKRKRKK